MKQASPLFINCCGLINPLGHDPKTIHRNLCDGDTSGVRVWDQEVQGKSVYVGIIDSVLPKVPAHLGQFACRNNQLILAACEQIQTNIDSLLTRLPANRVAIVLGSSTSGILEGENALQYRGEYGVFPEHFHYRQQEIGTPALFLREHLGLTGIALTVSTACSSSAKVFATAQRLIHSGICDAAIVGGADSLCRLTVHGFSSLESISAGLCNPMSVNRDGINVGEAAALFILSRSEAEVELLGVGESSDAYHMSAPHPQGTGAIQAMRAALADAQLGAEQISYINLHGTATPLNDTMESIAVSTVFGNEIPCSSTKPLTGHSLGAAGATEIGFCYLCLSDDKVQSLLPPHIWDGVVDPAIPRLNLLQRGESVRLISGTAFLSNSFAFGGNNASVIIGKR